MDEARCGAVCPGKFVPVLMFEGQTCSHISGHLPPILYWDLFFLPTLTQAAGLQPGEDLCQWEIGMKCERRYRVAEQWYNLRPAALAEYYVGQQHLCFWVEWDRGTMNVHDLATRFTSYSD
jgi:hypothetical protein